MPFESTVHTPSPSAVCGKSLAPLHADNHGAINHDHDNLVFAPPGPRPSQFGQTLTKTMIAAERKAEKETKAKLSEEKKLAMADCKAEALVKK